MTVLLVSGDFTPWGGMDRANYELAWYLAEHLGARVHLVSHQVAPPLAKHPNVVWHHVPKPMHSYTLGGPLLAGKGRRVAHSLQSRNARTVVNGANCAWPDINWVHWVQDAWKEPTPHLPTRQTVRARFCGGINAVGERRSLKMARIVIANSEKTRVKLVRDMSIPAERVHRIYYGTDPCVFRPATSVEKLAARERLGWADTPTVAFIGALSYDRRKGFDVLFQAWKELCADPRWDTDLVAAGAGAEVNVWKSNIESAGLNKRIRILGFTKNVSDILRAADALVHPARYEAYGLSVHEALCCGLPALVTKSAGAAERYPQDLADLLLDDPPAVKDLVQRLRRWRADMEGCRARVAPFGAKLRQRTWADMATEFVELTMPPPGHSNAAADFRTSRTVAV
jgi:glycosyltransferase involved in cell wall biosynthesis